MLKKSVLIIASMLVFIGCSDPVEDQTGFIIHFNTNGGSEITGLILKSGQTIFQPGDPKKAGSQFLGWHIDNNTFERPYDFYKPVVENITLYAKWDTATKGSGGGSGGAGGSSGGGSGTSAKPGTGGTDGNTTTEPDAGGTSPIVDDIVIVTFDTNGGSPIERRTLHRNFALNMSEVEIPEKANSKFDDWYTDNYLFMAHYNFATPVSSDLTLFAKWLETTYSVTYSVTYIDFYNTYSVDHVFEGAMAAKPKDPVRPLFNFAGWYTDEDSFKNAYNFSAPVTSDLVLYAKWDEKTGVSKDEINEAFDDVYKKYRDKLDYSGAAYYIVKSGDSLTKITRLSEVWGDFTGVGTAGTRNGFYFPLIMLASPDVGIVNPDLIQPGMKLTIIDLRRNLAKASSRAAIKDFLKEIAAVYKWKDGKAVADGLITLANSI